MLLLYYKYLTMIVPRIKSTSYKKIDIEGGFWGNKGIPRKLRYVNFW